MVFSRCHPIKQNLALYLALLHPILIDIISIIKAATIYIFPIRNAL
jgi:hypothetical protein